jgi:hypothetical protein
MMMTRSRYWSAVLLPAVAGAYGCDVERRAVHPRVLAGTLQAACGASKRRLCGGLSRRARGVLGTAPQSYECLEQLLDLSALPAKHTRARAPSMTKRLATPLTGGLASAVACAAGIELQSQAEGRLPAGGGVHAQATGSWVFGAWTDVVKQPW